MEPYPAYAVLGGTVLVLATAAAPIKQRLWLSEPLLATLIGVLLGPEVLGAFDPGQWGDAASVLEELARLTLAISLMGVALRLPDRWIKKRFRAVALILALGMPAMWFLCSLCAWSILGVPALQALLLGAILTPTDPVVASSIVTGKLAEDSVDADVRHLISAESGANDGLAMLLVMLPVLLMESDSPRAVEQWVMRVLLFKVVGSTLVGVVAGVLYARLLNFLHRRDDSNRVSLLAASTALSLLLLGALDYFRGDGILAVFAAGLAFNWVIRYGAGHAEAQHERIQETITRFFDVPVFMVFGMMLPWRAWFQLGWPALAFVAAVLCVRRIPPMLLLSRKLTLLKGLREAMFVGWFGPIAVAAMVYASWAKGHAGQEGLWHIATLVIFASILVHGATATPFTHWYARRSR